MKRMVLAAPALLFVGMIGCGGSDNGEKKAAPAAKTPAGQTVNVSESEYKLAPSSPKVKTGVVAFKVTNHGQVAHSLEVEGPKGEAKLGKKLQPGQSGTLKVNLSKGGKYEWYCPVDNHKGLGMKGEITVAGGGSSSGGGGSSSQSQGGGGGGY